MQEKILGLLKQSGTAFQGNYNLMSKGIGEAHEGARGIEGLLHYRLVGEGARMVLTSR